MLSVIQIVKHLNQAHANELRLILKEDSVYSELTLPIFDAYRNGESELQAQRSSNLKPNSFKIIERLIYRSILSLYNYEDIHVKDLVQTNLFYCIYGSTHKSNSQKREELESVFHQLKRFQIDQQAAQIVKQLAHLYTGTQLESVYKYMFNYYSKIESANNKIIELFTTFNEKLNAYISNDRDKDLKECILIYKQIRTICRKYDNKTAQSICVSCKLSLAVLANQSQILLDGAWKVEDLLKVSRNLVEALPFSMMRFYMENINTTLEITQLYKNGQVESAKNLFFVFNKGKKINAFNFNFPVFQLMKLPSITHKTLPINNKQKVSEYFKINSINNFMQLPLNKNNFGRERLSLFLN